MTNDRSFFTIEDNAQERASPGVVMTLALIAGVILAALACSLGAMLITSKLPEAVWTAFAVGTVFGASSVAGAALVASRCS